MSSPRIIVGDITALEVDAIVNAANAQLAPGGGVCGAIHRGAGGGLAAECALVGPCDTGDVRITGGYDLPAKHVIHAVGPVYHGGDCGEADLLASCYRRSLDLAGRSNLDSIAFPCISTGIFGYPLEAAARIALEALGVWISTGRQPQEVICCCFAEADAEVYRSLL